MVQKIKLILKKIRSWVCPKNLYPYRQYFDEHKCIYIHIPKTAGTSILTSLANEKRIYRDHATWIEFYKHNTKKYNDYFKFAFVRNPWDRAVSTYTYLKNGGNQNEDLYISQMILDKYNTFDQFVLDYLDENTIHEHGLFVPQYLFIYDHKQICKIDFIGKFEAIDEDFLYIQKILKLQMNIPNLNKSERVSYQHYYTNNKTIEKIALLYKRDIELFGYEFNKE